MNDSSTPLLRLALATGLDTTGTNPDRMKAEMAAARAAGFVVELVFITVPLTVSIERNLPAPEWSPPNPHGEGRHD